MLTVEVSCKTAVATDVYLFELCAVDGSALPAYTAGAHIDVEIQPGLLRQYSLCGPLDRPVVYNIAVLREPASRGGSLAMAETIQTGARLRIGAPRNLFALAKALAAPQPGEHLKMPRREASRFESGSGHHTARAAVP